MSKEYCGGSPYARVEYIFQGEDNPQTKVFETEETPIRIKTERKPVPAGENYNKEGFEIYFYSPNNYRWVRSLVVDYLIFPSKSAPRWPEYNYAGISRWTCGSDGFPRNSDGSLGGPGIDLDSLQIDTSKKCPVPMEEICHIKIYHEQKLLHQDQGKCPVDYNVNCDPCPPATIKCTKPDGTAECVPCEEFLNPLKAATNELRGING